MGKVTLDWDDETLVFCKYGIVYHLYLDMCSVVETEHIYLTDNLKEVFNEMENCVIDSMLGYVFSSNMIDAEDAKILWGIIVKAIEKYKNDYPAMQEWVESALMAFKEKMYVKLSEVISSRVDR